MRWAFSKSEFPDTECNLLEAADSVFICERFYERDIWKGEKAVMTFF